MVGRWKAIEEATQVALPPKQDDSGNEFTCEQRIAKCIQEIVDTEKEYVKVSIKIIMLFYITLFYVTVTRNISCEILGAYADGGLSTKRANVCAMHQLNKCYCGAKTI